MKDQHLDERFPNPGVIVDGDVTVVVLVEGKTVCVGVARRHPEDERDLQVGYEVALKRAQRRLRAHRRQKEFAAMIEEAINESLKDWPEGLRRILAGAS